MPEYLWIFCLFSKLDTSTLQETNISPKNGILKMIFLFPRWDMLIPWRVTLFQVGGLVQGLVYAPSRVSQRMAMGIFAHICRQGGCEVRPVFQLFWDSHGGYRKELSVGCDLQRETSSKHLRSWESCKRLTDWPNTSAFWSSYMIIKLLYSNPMAWKHGQFQIGTKAIQKSASVWYSRSYNSGFRNFWVEGDVRYP